LDTSAILGAWIRRFPRDVVPTFWVKFEALIDDGVVVCSSEVLDELERQSDEPLAWLKERKHMIRELTPEVIQAATVLVNEHPILKAGSTKNQADPFVVALAQVEDLVVISDEQPDAKAKQIKIPNLCEKIGLEHVDLFGFARRERWTF
jgi:hypothetical protein